MTLDTANLGPATTGVGAYIHVYQNLDRRARHAPRIKVFPGSPGDGDATTVVVPANSGQEPYVRGKITVKPRTLGRALRFAELNWQLLLHYWRDTTMSTAELLDLLVPVDL